MIEVEGLTKNYGTKLIEAKSLDWWIATTQTGTPIAPGSLVTPTP